MFTIYYTIHIYLFIDPSEKLHFIPFKNYFRRRRCKRDDFGHWQCAHTSSGKSERKLFPSSLFCLLLFLVLDSTVARQIHTIQSNIIWMSFGHIILVIFIWCVVRIDFCHFVTLFCVGILTKSIFNFSLFLVVHGDTCVCNSDTEIFLRPTKN